MDIEKQKESIMQDISDAISDKHDNFEQWINTPHPPIDFLGGFGAAESDFEFGDVLMACAIMGQRERKFDAYVGYVTQIRRKFGQFESDMFLVRHPDGTLCTHENQSFYRLKGELREKALAAFKWTPTDEIEDNPTLSYTIRDAYLESGFDIPHKGLEPITPPAPFAITVTNE